VCEPTRTEVARQSFAENRDALAAIVPPELRVGSFALSRGFQRAIFVADAHRDDGQRFIVRADEKLTTFLKLESAIQTDIELS
jgi:hypothetical protein